MLLHHRRCRGGNDYPETFGEMMGYLLGLVLVLFGIAVAACYLGELSRGPQFHSQRVELSIITGLSMMLIGAALSIGTAIRHRRRVEKESRLQQGAP